MTAHIPSRSMLSPFRRFIIAGVTAASVVEATTAAVPQYPTFQLQVRSNLCANPLQGTFNLPCDHFFGNGSPVINNNRQWCVKLDVMGASASQGVLYGIDGTAQIVYSTQPDDFMSDPWINNNGVIAWPQSFNSKGQNGIFTYNVAAGSGGLLTALPGGATAWSSVVINDSGQIGYRATTGGSNGWYSYQSAPVTTHALQNSLDASYPYTFLFSTHMNNARQIAGRVSIGTQDQIRRIDANGTVTIIAVDQDTNSGSPYSGFDASRPAIMDDGRVAFVANLAGGGRGIFLSDGTTTLTIVTTLSGQGVTNIESFPPDVNNSGLVVFRAFDDTPVTPLRAVWVGDGVTVRRVIREHDIVPSDNGPARIDQNDSSPVFGGAPSINDAGDVIFHCTLTPPRNNQIEWGSAIYVARAQRLGDVNGDGLVNVTDLLAVISAWGTCAGCPADINGDGTVNVTDLLTIISNWG